MSFKVTHSESIFVPLLKKKNPDLVWILLLQRQVNVFTPTLFNSSLGCVISFWSFPALQRLVIRLLVSASRSTFQVEQRPRSSISYCLKHIASPLCFQDLNILSLGVSAFHFSPAWDTHTHPRPQKYRSKWLDVNQSGIKQMEACTTAPNTGNGFIPPTPFLFPIILHCLQFCHHYVLTHDDIHCIHT